MRFSTSEGETVYFESNGDSPARYELVNLQMTGKGTLEGQTVGIYDASLPENHQFIMSDVPIVWGTDEMEVKKKPDIQFVCVLSCVYRAVLSKRVCARACVYVCCRCLCQCAVTGVSQEPTRSSRKESPSAALIVFHVQQERSVIPQVNKNNNIFFNPFKMHFLRKCTNKTP